MTPTTSRTTRNLAGLVGWFMLLGVAIALFTGLDDPRLATPAITDLAAWGDWAAGRDPIFTTIAILRLVLVGLTWYLLGASTIQVVARLTRSMAMMRVADAISVPLVRRVVSTTLGMGLAASMVSGASGNAVTGSPPPSGDAHVVATTVDDPASATTHQGPTMATGPSMIRADASPLGATGLDASTAEGAGATEGTTAAGGLQASEGATAAGHAGASAGATAAGSVQAANGATMSRSDRQRDPVSPTMRRLDDLVGTGADDQAPSTDHAATSSPDTGITMEVDLTQPVEAPTMRHADDQQPDSPRLERVDRAAPVAAVRADLPRVAVSGAPAAASHGWTVASGDHLWHIAETVMGEHLGHPADDAEITPYWLRLIEANRDRLPDPDNPDLIVPGLELRLPNPDPEAA